MIPRTVSPESAGVQKRPITATTKNSTNVASAQLAEQVHRPAAVRGEIFRREQVEEATQETVEAILRSAVLSRTVANDDLANLESSRGREDRDEPVHLAVEMQIAHQIPGHRLHAAIVIVEFDAGQAADESVEHAARQHLVPRIVADLLPAADQIESLAQLRQEIRNLRRIVLQVRVHGDHVGPACRVKARLESRGFAKVPAEANPTHTRIVRRQLLDYLPRRIATAIVDEEDLDVQIPLAGHGGDLAMQLRQAFALVVDRDYQ